jgi:hypothetical protein
MSNPTTPFSWQMPTNTDLVTDLPADFAVFGQAVATSMADLLGGTTGQVLSKATNADMDFTWTSANPGDITGVTAGIGISGGGTSGDVTVTNSMATAIDAKGDLVVGTGADTFSRLAVGTNNYVLTADSTAGTGVKWAAAGGSSLPTFSAYVATSQNFSTTTWTKVTFGTEEWDTNSNFASSRFTPTVSGYYTIVGRLDVQGTNANATIYGAIYKNGVNYKTLFQLTNTDTGLGMGGSSTVFFNGTTDYVEIYVYATSGSPFINPSQDGAWFNGVGVRA